jgi:hypothetical protein
LLLKGYEPLSSVIQTVAYCTERTILAGLEILNWGKIWTLGVIQWLKSFVEVRGRGVVESGLISYLLHVVNADYKILTWNVYARNWSWHIFAWQD